MNWIGLFQAEVERNKLEALKPTPAPTGKEIKVNKPTLRGENGTLEYSKEQIGDSRVALFFALVRNLPDERLTELLEHCLKQSVLYPLQASQMISDLFILAFQTRDCRGGKGERSIFYQLFLELYLYYPLIVIALLPLIAEYGYYKDYFNILSKISKSSDYTPLQDSIIKLITSQLKRDEEVLDRASESGEAVNVASISLCSKYAPRESNKFQKENKSLFRKLVMSIFPSTASNDIEEERAYARAKALYRKMISRLTQVTDVPEVKMCGKRYASIEFDHVPSVSMKKYRKAFANEKLGRHEIPSELSLTGNRSNDPDRIECRKNLLTAIKEKKIKGKQNYPHDIVHTLLLQNNAGSSVELEIFQQQWEDIRNNILRIIAERSSATTTTTTTSVNLNKLVPLVDVSGSMNGTPMEVAIALGILISEVNHPLFRDQFLTFQSTPSWVNLSSAKSIAEKVTITKQAPWGGSTNIENAFKLIARTIEANQLPESEIPDLIIFSDMQFNTAIRVKKKQTQLQRIANRFAELGIKISGKPYAMPRIIFWNLRGNTRGFPAQSSSENVQILSGFSPALFKYIVEGMDISQKKKVTPYDTFRKVMDDERYNAIREIVSKNL